MSELINRYHRNSFLNGHKVCIATTGPMTNLAVLLTVHPELTECIEEIVFMGGGVGIGNRSAVGEYNILCDRASDIYGPFSS